MSINPRTIHGVVAEIEASAATKARNDQVAGMEKSRSQNKLSVLLASSNARSLEAVHNLLTACGYEVQTARGGVDCVRQLQIWSPDVLVMNTQLDWGGAEGVLGMMGDRLVVPSVPVVAIAIQEEDSLPACFNQYPVVRILPNPHELWELVECIHFAAGVGKERMRQN